MPRLLAFLLVLFSLIESTTWAQPPAPHTLSTAEPVHRDVIERIRDEGLKRSQVAQTISYLTDVHGPRLTGSPITRGAGEWTRNKLTEWGLQQISSEPWGPFGRGWTLEGFTANAVAPTYWPLIAYPKAWSPSTPIAVRGQPVYLNATTEAELDRFRGRLHRAIVLLSPPREVKAQFDPLARRQSNDHLLGLANSDGTYRANRNVPGDSSLSAARGQGVAERTGQPPDAANPSRDASQMQNRKWQLIYDEGAAVVLEPGRGDGGTVFVGAVTLPRRADAASLTSPDGNPSSRGPRPWSPESPAAIPQVVVAVEHYNRCIRLLQKGIPLELEIDLAARFHTETLDSFNIIAEIPGSDRKDEIVMLGAHFDSWHSGTGATDNAVGCGVGMEAVRILQAIGAKPRRTIRLALWTGEEQGLLGSRAYVAEHFGRMIPPSVAAQGSPPATGGHPHSPATRPVNRYELKPDHDRLAAYFNLDNGTGRIRGVYLQGNEAVRPIFRAWLSPFRDLDASTLTLNNTSGTDHLSFDAVGLPGFQFIQDPLEYDTRTHHSSMDVFDRVQEEDVKQASVIMASFVYHAAMRDEKLPRKPIAGEIVRVGGQVPQ